MIITESFPVCDFCKKSYPDRYFDTRGACRLHMKLAGWNQVGGKDKCPDCVAREELGK